MNNRTEINIKQDNELNNSLSIQKISRGRGVKSLLQNSLRPHPNLKFTHAKLEK